MSGYFEIGIPVSVIRPIMTIRIEITMATMGLRIKNSLIREGRVNVVVGLFQGRRVFGPFHVNSLDL